MWTSFTWTDTVHHMAIGETRVDVEAFPLPEVVDRAAWQAQLDALLVREKAHTREGDAIAAARRRLPMVETDPAATVTGLRGPVPLREVFEGRTQLVAYFFMWHDGHPAAEQCEGCTFFAGQLLEPATLHSRDITYAVFCEGTYEESIRYHDFMGWNMPWYSARDSIEVIAGVGGFGLLAFYLRRGDRVFQTYWTTGRGTEVMAPAYGVLDRTVYGRQEDWEDSPAGWPHRWGNDGGQFRVDGRPAAQWSRLAAGRSDDLSVSEPGRRQQG